MCQFLLSAAGWSALQFCWKVEYWRVVHWDCETLPVILPVPRKRSMDVGIVMRLGSNLNKGHLGTICMGVTVLVSTLLQRAKISYLLTPMTKWESFTTAALFFVSFCDFFVDKTIPFHRRSRAFWTTKNTKFLRHLTTKNTKNHFFEIFLPKGFSPKRTQNDKKACFYLFKSSSSALTEAVSYVCSKMWFFVFFGIHTATLALQCSILRVLLRKNILLPTFPGRESKVFTFW